MNLRHAQWLGMAGLALAAALGCGKFSRDTSKVIASVAGEKITEKTFAETVKAMVPDEAKAKEVLSSEALRPKRNEFLGQLAKGKALVHFGKAQGLDKDPGLQVRLEQLTAQAYIQTLMERRMPKTAPEAELRAMYDQVAAQIQAQGKDAQKAQPLPPFEQVKPQLEMRWKQEQEGKVFEQILKEATQKSPITYADDYKPAQM
jgi:hypothetical protein